MRTISLDRVPGWRQLKQGFADSCRSARLHHELAGLSDRYLQDIGLDGIAAGHLDYSRLFFLHRP